MKKFSIPLTIVVFMLANVGLNAQVGINSDGSAPHPSAMLEVKSSDKGLLIPRLTTTQRNSLGATATAGLMVFDSSLNLFFFFDGTGWKEVSTGNLWQTDGPNVYLHDNADFVGIGTATPLRKLEINADWKPLRLTTTSSGPFIEFTGSSTTDWTIGMWGNAFWLTSSTDNFSSWTDQFYFSTTSFRSYYDNTKTLGESGSRWINIYSLDGNFSGLLTGNTGFFSGDFGIGTASPARKFEVNAGSAWRSARITTTSSGAFLEFVSNSNPDWAIGEWDGALRILSSTDNFTNSTDQYFITDATFRPFSDNTKTLGSSTARWSHLYCNDAHLYGTVAVGNTIATGYKLSVEGKIICTELRVNNVVNWPDYVLGSEYDLMPLEHLRKYISENGHLPNIPPAGEIEGAGMEIGEMQRLMMEKLEELTLYILQQQEQIEALQAEIERLQR